MCVYMYASVCMHVCMVIPRYLGAYYEMYIYEFVRGERAVRKKRESRLECLEERGRKWKLVLKGFSKLLSKCKRATY